MASSPTGIRIRDADDSSAVPAAVERGVPPALSLSEHLSRYRFTLLGVSLALFGVFSSVAIVPYAFGDDYTDLWMVVTGRPNAYFGKSVLDLNAVEGHPLSGLLVTAFFKAAGTIENLRFVRLFAVISIAALAVLLHWALVRSKVKPIVAGLIAVFVFSLPTYQVYASWAVTSSYPLGALLAGGASLVAVATVDGPRNLMRYRLLGATGLLVAALLIYQPSAMLFWVFFAVALVGAAQDSRRSVRLTQAHFGVGIAALALSYLELKISVLMIGEAAPGATRSNLTHDVVGKARWFFHEPLYQSLNLFDLTPTWWFAALVAIVAAVGIVLWLIRQGARPWLYIGIGIALIPLTYLPNLVVAENWASFRTRPGIEALLALYFCLGVLGIWLAFRDWLEPRVSHGVVLASERLAFTAAFLFVATSVVAGANNVISLFVLPHITEQRMLRSQVAALPEGTRRIGFVQSNWHLLTNLELYDEFGLPSSNAQWTLEPSVNLILREEGRLGAGTSGVYPTVDILPSYTTTLPKNEPVIDLRGLARLR
jgi:hypothetical protein